MKRVLLLLGVVTLAAGCGGARRSAPPATTTAPAQERTALTIYGAKDGKLVAERRLVPRTQALARAALEALGLSVDSLEIAGGTATVGLTPAPTGLAIAQVVFTLTEFATVQRVAIGGQTLTRADEEQYAPAILVVSPPPGDTVTSPVRVSGTADTFEATFVVDVVDGDGRVVAEQTVTATAGSGERGSFDASIPFEGAKPGRGEVVAFERSAENGERIHVVEIPVVFP